VDNLGNLYTDGIDFSASYLIPYHKFGDFSLNFDYTYTRDYIDSGQDVSNVDGSHSQQYVGFSPHPRHRANLTVNWDLDNWSASYRIIYLGRQIADCSRLVNNGFPELCTDPKHDVVNPAGRLIPTYRISPKVYNNVRVSYDFSPINTTLTVGLDNLFGEEPPKYSGLGLTGFYPIPGRFLYARLTTRF
jgi:hypothetical protein